MPSSQEKAGYAAELDGLIEQMEGLVGEKAALEEERAQQAQRAAELEERCQAAQVRGGKWGGGWVTWAGAACCANALGAWVPRLALGHTVQAAPLQVCAAALPCPTGAQKPCTGRPACHWHSYLHSKAPRGTARHLFNCLQVEAEGLRGQLGGAEGLSAQVVALQHELDRLADEREQAALQRWGVG